MPVNFEAQLSYQAVFLHNQRVRTKNIDISRTKELLKGIEKHFSSFLMGFQLLEIVSDPRLGL